MKKNKCIHFKKLSDMSQTSLTAARNKLAILEQLNAKSTEVGEEIWQVVEKLRQVAAPAGEPFTFTSLVTQNEQLLRAAFRNCDDIKFRIFDAMGQKALLVYLDGMTDITLLEKNVLEILMQPAQGNNQQRKSPLDVKTLQENLITSALFITISQASQAIDAVLTGNAMLMLDGIKDAFIIGSKQHVKRNIEEAKTEGVAQGAHDGFNETLADGIVLIRRRARDNNIKVNILQIGERSKTAVALVYVGNLVKPGLVGEVERRLKKIKVDKILLSYTIQELLSEHPWTPFPLAQRTERPDAVAAAIYEGRVGIIVDNTPMALIVPCTYASLMQSVDDYSSAAVSSSLIRLLRHVSALIAIYMPALYIAIVSYHPGMLPTTLAISIAELRARTPFPAFLEALMMIVVLEIFQEAIIRTPQKVVTAASIVGGLVIGTTIVQAGISNPLLVVVIAMTAISTFCTPYSFGLALRTLRIPMVLLASTLGLYGLMLGALMVTVHMCSLRSFGESYLGDLFDITLLEDWKDMLVRVPAKFLGSRPKQYGPQERTRQGDSDG